MIDRLLDYKRKCKVLKQIQSNKARRYRRWNHSLIFITIFFSALVTFIGFSGVEKIKEYLLILNIIDVEVNSIQMIYNLFVFSLFFVVIFHLAFQFSSKQTDSEKAISLLSSLINEIDDTIEGAQILMNNNIVDSLRYKYDVITQIISSNTDKQYLKAKKSLYEKVKGAETIEKQNLLALSIQEQEEYIINLIERNNQIQRILDVLKDQSEDLYMGGGIIRNIVWDNLHNYASMTPIEDVDVIYYDNISATKERDIEIENRLKSIVPNLNWSVKNQARMHIYNNEDPYSSLHDAVSKWPETVSSILVRKSKDGKYEFIAPYNFDDLFRLIVQPTPHFMSKLDRYKERIKYKKWEEKWGKLLIFNKD